jgi:hypothetical protein
MLSILSDLLEIFENIPLYIEYAGEMVINGYFAIVQALLLAANALLGGLPEVISPPGYLTEINWYYPVGTLVSTLVSIAGTGFSLYITWLGISWLYKRFGAI